jgi:hypothetical protein
VAVPKDERLAALSDAHNVAQFVSFTSGAHPTTRYSRVRERPRDELLSDVKLAIENLLQQSGTVNVRSFRPDQDKGNPFHYGLGSSAEAAALVYDLAHQGYMTIVNETIDTNDGGVSGVVLGDLIEFVPGDTPRGVEKPGVASLPLGLGLQILSTVYGFTPELPVSVDSRVEFSIHPLRAGYRHEHTVVWETEQVGAHAARPTLVWPNRFSRFVGDKAYGLLMASCLGLPVPRTTVIARTVAPFQFGTSTGPGEVWIRPCPGEQQPGLYPTTRGWHDPYELLKLGHPEGTAVRSVLAQDGVDAAFSGATLPADDEDWVEGLAGYGDGFMQGDAAPASLPDGVTTSVRALAAKARHTLGPVRLEFAHDGTQPWVLQMHVSSDTYRGAMVYPGEPKQGWLTFRPSDGLDTLRELIKTALADGKGIRITEPVGVTSHVGDLLRRAKVPSVIDIR